MKTVIKLGGSLMKTGVPQSFIEDLASLSPTHRIVLVHGGGDVVTETAQKLGKEQRFIVSPDGIRSRYTDAETAEIYLMVMSGLLSKRLVLTLEKAGVSSVSLSGIDGGLMRAKRKTRLVAMDERGRRIAMDGGYTGKISQVNTQLIEELLSGGYLPVVSPVAISEASEPLNVDGDRAAGAIAGAMGADSIVFSTNVDGLLIDGRLVEHLTSAKAEALVPKIGFGMQKKVLAATEAVNQGVKEAIISSGLRERPISQAFEHRGCTVITQS